MILYLVGYQVYLLHGSYITMPLFWSKTVEEKNVETLLGSISKLPAEEKRLYSLSSICMRDIKDTGRPSKPGQAQDNFHDLTADCDPEENETDVDPRSTAQNRTHEQQQVLFKPKLPLPPPIFRQTYNMWKAVMDINFRFWRVKRRRVIYIQPLDTFPDFICSFSYSGKGSSVGFFELLKDFCEIFFMGFEVRIRHPLDTSETGWNITSRHHKITKKKQYLVTDINEQMKLAIPKDGYCMLGVTWTDLYPSEELNFVLGEAAARHYTATFCFGHYEPKSYCEGKQPIEQIDGFILWRMLKVRTFVCSPLLHP